MHTYKLWHLHTHTTDTHTNKHTHTHRDTLTNIHTHTQTNEHKYTHTYTDKCDKRQRPARHNTPWITLQVYSQQAAADAKCVLQTPLLHARLECGTFINFQAGLSAAVTHLSLSLSRSSSSRAFVHLWSFICYIPTQAFIEMGEA